MWLRSLVVGLVAGAALMSSAASIFAQPAGGGPPGGMPGMGAAGPTQVGVVTLARQTVAMTQLLPGRVAASDSAEIRPQVGGILESVEFREGAIVEEGDLLFTLQDDSFEAALAVANANLERVQAALASAQAKADRYERLGDGGGVSEAELLDAQVSLRQAEADVKVQEANVTTAEINLQQTRITAPMSGVIGLTDARPGTLVTAGQATALATIRQLNPAHITLVDSSRNLIGMRQETAGLEVDPETVEPPMVTITLEDGSTYDQTGFVEVADLVVSEATGTFSLRASMPNPDMILLPGMFVRATVSLGEGEQAFLVPQRAVTRDANGEATAFFVSDGKAMRKTLTTDRTYNNSWVVTSGVEDGDQLIVDGLQKISEGSEVSAVGVTIDENGVVAQELVSPPAGGATNGAGAPGSAPPAAEGATPPAGGAAQ